MSSKYQCRFPYRRIPNVCGFEDLGNFADNSRLLEALQPYAEWPQVKAEIKHLRNELRASGDGRRPAP